MILNSGIKKGDKVADFCAGSGIVGMHFYALNKDLSRVDGYEIQPELADTFKRTIEYNGLEDKVFCYNMPIQEIGKELNGKYTAFPIMFFLLAGGLYITVIGANYPSDMLFSLLFSVEDKLLVLLEKIGAPDIIIHLFLFGVYRTSAWVVSVMLPPMAIFFPLFTLLEDLGYLPRIAYNMDGAFQKCSACGKQYFHLYHSFSTFEFRETDRIIPISISNTNSAVPP